MKKWAKNSIKRIPAFGIAYFKKKKKKKKAA